MEVKRGEDRPPVELAQDIGFGKFASMKDAPRFRLWRYLLGPILGVTLAGCAETLREGVVANPKAFDSQTISFQYPARRWRIEKQEPDYDPNSNVMLYYPKFDSMVQILLYETDLPIDEELKASLDGLEETFSAISLERPVTAWGRFEGAGFDLTARVKNVKYHMTVFVAPVKGPWVLEVRTVWPEWFNVRDLVVPGIELIRDSLRVEPGPVTPAVPDDAEPPAKA